MKQFLDALANMQPDFISVFLISTLTSIAVPALFNHVLKRKEVQHTARVGYEYEARKELNRLVGIYQGRLLHAANTMNYRMWNLYSNHDKDWLNVKGCYDDCGYYYMSTIYRFMSVSAYARLVERQAFLLDSSIASKNQIEFLSYVAAMNWVMTDTALTANLVYDYDKQTDHFFSDDFRYYCDSCLVNDEFIEYTDFKLFVVSVSKISPVLKYFDGIAKCEPRYRWDRLVAYHLLVMAFVNTFGYKRQRTSTANFIDVAKHINNREVIDNLIEWLPRHELGNESQRIIKALECARIPFRYS